MKVALIDPVGGKMGMNHYDDGLMQGLNKCGFTTFLLSNYVSRFDGVNSKIFFDNINKNRMQSAWSNFSGIIRSLWFCKKEKINAAIFHIFRGGLFDLFSLLLVKIFGLKILLIVHDIETIDTPTYKFLKRIVLKYFYDGMVVHNEFSHKKILEFLNLPSMDNIHVIPHGNYSHLADRHYSREEALNYFQLDPSINYLLFFGQVKKTKGLDVLLKALHLSKGNYRLIIAGKLRTKSFKPYQEIIDQYNIESKIIKILRYVSDEEVAMLFALSRAVVLPYEHIYQSGVLLRAMSYGRIVIASDLEPFKEIIDNGVNGLLFPVNNSTKLAEIIEELLYGTNDIKTIEHRAKQFSIDNYSWDKIAESFGKVLHSL